MAGVATHPTGRSPRGARRRSALAAAGLALCALLLADRSASPSEAGAAKPAPPCPAPPGGLAAPCSSADRFTMMIRINTDGNVNTWTKPDGGMGGRVRPQDLLVLNPRSYGSRHVP